MLEVGKVKGRIASMASGGMRLLFYQDPISVRQISAKPKKEQLQKFAERSAVNRVAEHHE